MLSKNGLTRVAALVYVCSVLALVWASIPGIVQAIMVFKEYSTDVLQFSLGIMFKLLLVGAAVLTLCTSWFIQYSKKNAMYVAELFVSLFFLTPMVAMGYFLFLPQLLIGLSIAIVVMGSAEWLHRRYNKRLGEVQERKAKKLERMRASRMDVAAITYT